MTVSEHRLLMWRFVGVAGDQAMHSIVYLVGLIVIVLAILSFLGLR